MEQRFDDPSDELEQLDEDAPEAQYEDDNEPQAPVMVQIRLNGRTVTVTEEVADLIHAREEEQKRIIGRQGEELGQLRARTRPEPQQAPEPSDNDDLEFFTSPSKAMAKRLAEAEERAYKKIQADLDIKERQKQYWGKFYADNKDLSDHEEVVQFVVQKHYDDLKDLSPAESQREIAAKVNAFLGRSQQGKPLPNRPAQAERPSHPAPQGRPAQPKEAPKRRYIGLSAILAENAEKKRRQKYQLSKDE